MGASRELMEVSRNGVQVWVCSKCQWAHPYPQSEKIQEGSANKLLKEFARHDCAEFPRARGRKPLLIKGGLEWSKSAANHSVDASGGPTDTAAQIGNTQDSAVLPGEKEGAE